MRAHLRGAEPNIFGSFDELEAKRAAIAQLNTQFTAIEKEALLTEAAPLGSYIVCRADGIKASKKYLADKLTYPAFKEALHGAVETVYHLFRRCTGEEHGEREGGNFFLGIIAVSDEVSFILNNRRNFLKNRLVKTTTSLASALSGAMSLSFAEESTKYARPAANGYRRPQVMAFDGRPLVLESYALVEEYLKHRWLLSVRSAMCKVLRVQKIVDDRTLYDTGLKDELPRLADLIVQHGMENECAQLMSEFCLFLPGESHAEARLVPYLAAPCVDDEALSLCRRQLRRMAAGSRADPSSRISGESSKSQVWGTLQVPLSAKEIMPLPSGRTT